MQERHVGERYRSGSGAEGERLLLKARNVSKTMTFPTGLDFRKYSDEEMTTMLAEAGEASKHARKLFVRVFPEIKTSWERHCFTHVPSFQEEPLALSATSTPVSFSDVPLLHPVSLVNPALLPAGDASLSLAVRNSSAPI